MRVLYTRDETTLSKFQVSFPDDMLLMDIYHLSSFMIVLYLSILLRIYLEGFVSCIIFHFISFLIDILE